MCRAGHSVMPGCGALATTAPQRVVVAAAGRHFCSSDAEYGAALTSTSSQAMACSCGATRPSTASTGGKAARWCSSSAPLPGPEGFQRPETDRSPSRPAEEPTVQQPAGQAGRTVGSGADGLGSPLVLEQPRGIERFCLAEWRAIDRGHPVYKVVIDKRATGLVGCKSGLPVREPAERGRASLSCATASSAPAARHVGEL